jgi:hypothetical protein
MSDEFSIECEWLTADLDDPAEASTTAEVSVAVGDEQLTRIFEVTSVKLV